MRNEDIGATNGRAAISPEDAVVAGTCGAWTVTYTAGEDGLAVGGSVRFEIPYGFSPPQLLWPHDAGYASAACSRRDVRVRLSLEPPVKLDPQPFYYVTRWGRMVYVQVLEQPLRAGDTIALRLGSRHTHGPGVAAPYLAQRYEFTVATDHDGTRSARFSGYTLLAEQPALEVVAARPQHLAVVAPSVVAVGEEFVLRVQARDDFGNPAVRQPAEIELATGLEEVDLLPVAADLHGAAFQVAFDVPGERRLWVGADDDILAADCNPQRCEPAEPERRLFWGDIHGHTSLSDGLGTPEEYYRFGRDAAFLDFCAITDHAQYLSDEDWEAIQRATAEFNEPERFATLLGYEFSCNANLEHYGDKCLYYPGDSGPLLRETDLLQSSYVDVAAFADQWKAHGAMMIPHQHAKGTCSFYDPDLVRLAEVYSVWGASESEYSTRPLLPAKDDDYAGHYAADGLEKGWVLGLMASSDDHAGRPGNTDWLRVQQAYPGGLVAVWAAELTREAVWEALWNRRCYGTTGARIYLEFYVDGEPMGSVIEGSAFSGTHVIEVRALGEHPFVAVELLRGRHLVYVHSTYSPTVQLGFRDTPPPGSANYYYVRLTQSDGEMAWSSPVWIV